MKKNSFVLRVTIFFLVCSGALLGGWFWWNDAVSPPDQMDQIPNTFSVRTGESVKSIASRLTSEGLIRSPTAFYILVKLLGIERSLQAGDYRLTKSMSAQVLAGELTHGIVDIWVTTLEGWRVEEIASKLTKELDIPAQEFLKVAEEGYMFPDTYQLPREATAGAAASIMRSNFDKKITAELRDDISKQDLSLAEVIILASIVEREGHTDQDRPVIAGILRKRLEAEWPLQVDATLQYALGYQSNEKTWWKKSLFAEDKEIVSPYNTYKYPGLPPTPIASPGISSIRAVIRSKESEYWYYLHDAKGNVYYGKTLEEHNQNIKEHLLY